MSLTLGRLEMHMGPRELGAPDDLEQVIRDFIAGARKELLIAVQELESIPIAEAVIAARARGVRVRLILEKNYLTLSRAPADPWTRGGENEENRRILAALLRARVDLMSDLNPETFHQKFMVRDADTSRAAVLTGSTNFTPTGTHTNLNHVVIMKSKRMAALFVEEFEEAWTGRMKVGTTPTTKRPREYDVSGVRVKALFAPDQSPEMEMMKQMLKAKNRVAFAIFTFSQSSGIDDACICLSRAGIAVEGVMDRMQGNQEWAATRPVANAGATLYWPKRESGVRKVHHKLMVIDNTVVVAGSFNFTEPANMLNDENILVIGRHEEDDPEAKKSQRQFARYAAKEIERMRVELCEKVG
ncbi:MAG: phospholipase [Chitinivibrionales bacterium]|nr:phospholipase [Chitinivibrionales bacterium]MBD3396516.1 phospholipase [Chitinivibrionales bacterium]